MATPRRSALPSTGWLLRQEVTGRCCWLEVGIFSRDKATREELAERLRALSFSRSGSPRGYRETVAIDLASDEASLFAGFHKKVRRDIRVAV